MDENKNYQTDPWESGIYETGRTRPPKSHTGLIALLLVVVIFLSGLVSFLGLLNVKLFAQLNAQPEEKESSVSFVSETEAAPDILEIQDPSAAAVPPSAALRSCAGTKESPPRTTISRSMTTAVVMLMVSSSQVKRRA